MTGRPKKPAEVDGPRKCSGTVRHGPRKGEPCDLRPIRGGTVCHKHGGKARQVREAAERRIAEAAVLQEMERAVTTYGLPADVQPVDALLQELRRTAGHVAWLGQVVGETTREDLVRMGPFGPIIDAHLTLYQQERKHLARVAADAVRCGLEAKRVELEQQKAQVIVDLLRNVLTELGLNPRDQQVTEVVTRHLRALEGGQAA